MGVHDGRRGLLWLWIGGLLLKAGTQDLLPGWNAAAAVALYILGALAGISAMYPMVDTTGIWPSFALGLIPPILLGVVYAVNRGMSPNVAMWAVLAVLSLAPLPAALQKFQAERARHTRLENKFNQYAVNEAKRNRAGNLVKLPGPKLDAWMAKQQDKRRTGELAEFSRIDGETTLMEMEHLIRPDGPVREEALAAIRKQPNRQAEATQLLQDDYFSILHFLGDIDVQPTPELC